MNRILVATDGSEGADRAVDYASLRAKDDSAELLIVNVIGGYGLPDDAKLVRVLARQSPRDPFGSDHACAISLLARTPGAGVSPFVAKSSFAQMSAEELPWCTGVIPLPSIFGVVSRSR
jgi:nucleotide-binding universal stress UspA family protein